MVAHDMRTETIQPPKTLGGLRLASPGPPTVTQEQGSIYYCDLSADVLDLWVRDRRIMSVRNERGLTLLQSRLIAISNGSP